MGIPAIRLSEKARRRLGLISAIANFCCILPSLVLFGLGGYMQASVQEKVDLIKGYGGHYLPSMIISLGLIYLVINLAGGKICLDNTKHRNRKKRRVIFAAYIYLSSIMCFVVLLSAILCFSQIANLHHSFHDGISSAMKKYRFNARMKETIDKLQIEFQCCGNTDFKDWFSTAWIDEQYLAVDSSGGQSHMSTGHYVSDDAPFSCCNVYAIRPCIHHRVLSNNHHFNYKHAEELTLYKKGCKQALMEVYGGQLLTNVGIIIIVIALLQICVVVCARYLQTSSLRALKKGAPKDPATGWLIPWPKRHSKSRRSEVSEEVEEEGKEEPEQEDTEEEESGSGHVLQDQSYSTHGFSGPAAPPPLPPSFGAAFNQSNNHSNINFSNVRRLPPPAPQTPPRLKPPPPPPQTLSPNRQIIRYALSSSPRKQLNKQFTKWPPENVPFRRQSNNQRQSSIPMFQNGFYRNYN